MKHRENPLIFLVRPLLDSKVEGPRQGARRRAPIRGLAFIRANPPESRVCVPTLINLTRRIMTKFVTHDRRLEPAAPPGEAGAALKL